MIFSCPVSSTSSPAVISSSKSFSPGRRPVNLISISAGSLPERTIKSRAKSAMRTGLPIFSTKISPPRPWAPAWTMSWAASGMVMKYRVTSGWVTVTGPPRSIWSRKRGMTEPDEPRTLPKRTAINKVPPPVKPCIISSATRLDAPMTLVGRTALSVDTSTKRSTPCRTEASMTVREPTMLFVTACQGLSSSMGTCL
ncbi:hypothetical protein DSECCO2_451650 [anaerobic digester metagenome]